MRRLSLLLIPLLASIVHSISLESCRSLKCDQSFICIEKIGKKQYFLNKTKKLNFTLKKVTLSIADVRMALNAEITSYNFHQKVAHA